MKTSPIQLLRLMFKHVKVEVDPTHLPSKIPNPLEAVFTFDGVNIHTEVAIGEAIPQDDGPVYFLQLQVVVNNQTQPDVVNPKYAPYTIDIAVEGVVLVLKDTEQLGSPDDLAVVNGTSLLWSAVREQILSLTARMRPGPAMLPTVHFHDLKREAQQASADVPATEGTQGPREPRSKSK